MLCAPVFIFTSGSSALLGCPSCGLLIGLSLLAIFNTLFWVYVNLFREKTDKTWYVWYENGRLQLLDAKTINTESLFKLGSKWLIITDINNYCMYKLLCAMHSLQLCKNNCLGGGGKWWQTDSTSFPKREKPWERGWNRLGKLLQNRARLFESWL